MTPFARCSIVLVLVGLGGANCAPLGQSAGGQIPGGSESEAPQEPPSVPLAPLNEEGERLRGQLGAELGALCEFGPRSLAHSWQLHGATDHIARTLEKEGYEVHREGFEVGEELLQNLEVVLLPEPLKDPVEQAKALLFNPALVVAASYDSAAESPAADASASGAAALLVLARALREVSLKRAVRLVWLTNEGGADGPKGSEIYVQSIERREAKVGAAIVLGGLGHYSVEAGSQRYPDQLLYGAAGRTRRGDFLGVLYNARSSALYEQLSTQWSQAFLPVQALVLPESASLASNGPQSAFWGAGWTTLLFTDTADYRSPHYNTPEDTVERLDWDRYVRGVSLVHGVVQQLTGAKTPSL